MNKEKILIALGDASLGREVEDKLKNKGYSGIMVTSGEDALQKMRSDNPDIVLVDLVLSGKNGYEVLTEKSFDRMITKIPTIVVSNSGAPIEMRKIPSTSSVKDYIIKAHVSSDEVLNKIGTVLGKSDLQIDPASKDAAQAKLVGKNILWVEDDKFLSSILLKKFESSGHTVFKADNGEEALKLVAEKKPDIIIIDILLPGMDGFEVLQKIKTDPKFRTIPVIVLSNTSKPSDLEKAKMLGAQKFLLKAAVSLEQIVKEVVTLAK